MAAEHNHEWRGRTKIVVFCLDSFWFLLAGKVDQAQRHVRFSSCNKYG
jgi:hypothetical protein